MIKKLIYLIIPIIFFSFSQNVDAQTIQYTEPYTKKTFSYNLDTNKYPYYYLKYQYDNADKTNVDWSFTYSKTPFYFYKNFMDGSNSGKINVILPDNGQTIYYYYKNGSGGSGNNSFISITDNPSSITFPTTNYILRYSTIDGFYENNVFKLNTVDNYYNNGMYNNSSFGILCYLSNDIYDKEGNLILSKDYVNSGFIDLKPQLSYSLNPIYKDGYISSYGIKVKSTIVDDTKYKYQYAIKDDTNDNLKWVDLYNNNFLNNQFSYVTKKPIYFYFRILDKSNNEVIDSFTITVTFNLVSPQYEIIFNKSKFYLKGTNYIDRVGLSITYKTSVNGLKYQYQYVNDGSSIDENNWVDTESDIYQVYNVNGVLYARILDNDNNVLYSSTFTNTLIGTQDILENPTNFPLYNKVQNILNFNKGTISDLVLIPVKILMFMTDSLKSNVCNEYSFGTLLGHELKLPCIDIKAYVGNTIYNFYDLVCSFFISLGIIKLLKNIYMRFMTLEIRDIDNKGGIF